MMKKKTLCILLGILGCLSACGNDSKEKQWQQEIERLDQEIETLTQEAEEYRAKANEEQRQAQKFWLEDWKGYRREIQDYERYDNLEEAANKRIEALEQQKKSILKQMRKK